MSTHSGASHAAAGVAALFKETSLQDLMSAQSVVILKDTATVDQALKTLAARRILSAPVVSTADADKAGCGCLGPMLGPAVPPGAHWPQGRGLSDAGAILGFLDVRDVLSSFLADLDVERLGGMKMLQRMRLLEERGAAYATTMLKDLKVFGGDGDFLPANEASKTTLMEVVLHGLLQPKDRGSHTGRHIISGTVHRVGIYDTHFRLTNIISQTDIVKFLHMNPDALGELGGQTAEELGWTARPVVSLGPDVSAIEAMTLMNERQINAVAVVDGVGKIIGNFSVSEMRSIMAEHFGALSLPVGEFLALEHGTEFQGYSHIHEQEVVASKGHKFITDRIARARPRTPGEEVGQALVLVTPQTPLLEVIDKIVSNRIHRVYIIDDAERPVGVVTCTDVVRLVVRVTRKALLDGSAHGGAAGEGGEGDEQQQAGQQQQQQPAAAAGADADASEARAPEAAPPQYDAGARDPAGPCDTSRFLELLRERQAAAGGAGASSSAGGPPGRVYLVGTGPGDPGLLTLRAVQLMQTADVVLYDRLVSDDVLRLVHGGARMVYVGKAAGFHTRSQAEIHELLLQFAEAGATVVRLKGGDPYVFGRGGEEVAYLAARGVPVHAVPGITAAAGICAELGIPMTHRGVATSVRFLTGHAREGGEAALDASVAAAADPGSTLVVYMGLATLPALVEQLTADGRMPRDLPAVAVERGTTAAQRVVFAPLGGLHAAISAAGLQSPTLLVIGEVVALSPGWAAAAAGTQPQQAPRHPALDCARLQLPDAVAAVLRPAERSAPQQQQPAAPREREHELGRR
ncbi:cysG [Scenedesmus sp. PABB004]|nr:cysG [Scenedesmus sp. PABB004]